MSRCFQMERGQGGIRGKERAGKFTPFTPLTTFETKRLAASSRLNVRILPRLLQRILFGTITEGRRHIGFGFQYNAAAFVMVQVSERPNAAIYIQRDIESSCLYPLGPFGHTLTLDLKSSYGMTHLGCTQIVKAMFSSLLSSGSFTSAESILSQLTACLRGLSPWQPIA